MSATGIDLAAPGKQHATVAGDVRQLVLARLKGQAAVLDPDDLVQDVYRRILRRNQLPCAYDPEKASVSKYVFRVTSCAIADALSALRREQRGREDDSALDAVADELDEDALPWDPDAAPDDVDGREAFFLAACCLHVFGELPDAVELWQRALRQREQEQAPGHQETLGYVLPAVEQLPEWTRATATASDPVRGHEAPSLSPPRIREERGSEQIRLPW